MPLDKKVTTLNSQLTPSNLSALEIHELMSLYNNLNQMMTTVVSAIKDKSSI